jgi:DNA invertase Pin-like site-specific DNA recombinase
MRRAVIYLRVSTLDQTTANQERELREIAGRMGCEIVKVYRDHGISGAKGRDKRPAFDKLCRDAARREFDMVMAWSVDRLGRSLQDLVGFLSELHSLRIDLFLRQQGLDTTTPAGKAMFQMMGVFAEFERAMIAERVRAGLARARSEGKRLGRPPIAPSLEKRIREALATPGRPGVRVIAKQFGVDPGTVQRISRPFDSVGIGVVVAQPLGARNEANDPLGTFHVRRGRPSLLDSERFRSTPRTYGRFRGILSLR